MAQPLYLPIVLLAGVVGMAVALFAWHHRAQPGARPLAVLVIAASFWAVAEGLTIATAGVGTIRFWTQVGLTMSAIVPVAWLVTVLEYTGRDARLTRRTLLALLCWPAVFVGLVWTNESHGLVWTAATRNFLGEYSLFAIDFGLGFWAHQVFSYALVTAGALLLVRMILRTDQLYQSQSTALLVGITVPIVGNALYIFQILPRGLDPSGVGYVLTGVVVAGAIFRAQLLQVAPAVRELGREEALSELDDAVFILDDHDRIVDANPAAASLIGTETGYLGQPLAEQLPALTDAIEAEESPLRLERDGAVSYYDVQVSSLERGFGTLSGRLVSLREITEQRRREQRLDVLNRVLRHNIRNELTVVRGNVELARTEAGSADVTEPLEAAIETVDTMADRSDKVGHLSRLFESSPTGVIDLAAHLESTLSTIAREHPDVAVSLSVPEPLPVAAGHSVTVAFDELVTNAIEHNDSDNPSVAVTVDEDASDDQSVVVTVSDDGPGIEPHERRVIEVGRETPLEHGSGIGLWLANWVVERHGGTLSFADAAEGTTAVVRLPRAEAATVTDGADDPTTPESVDDAPSDQPEPTPDGGDEE